MGDFTINGVNLLNPDDPLALREVMKKSSAEVWRTFEAYMEINANDHSSKVLLLKKFPFEEYADADLHEIVLKDKHHIVSCETCYSHVIGRRILYLTKSKDINLSNCISLRILAIEYDDDKWKGNIDDFIAENFAEACKQPESDVIKSFCSDDIFRYVRTTTRSCNKSEFTAIINWLRADTKRHSLFPELLAEDGRPSLFKTSLRSLCELENDSILSSLTKYLRSSEQKPSWIVSKDNFGFVRYLTQHYVCEVTQKQVDRFTQENLSQLADKPDVGSLPVDAIKKYASDETFYEDGTTRGSVWILIKNWIKRQSHITKKDLSKILASLLIGKLSYDILREYSKHDIVRESSACQANLIEVILANASAVQNSHVSLRKQVSDAEKKSEKLEAAMTKTSENNASRDKVISELKNDMNTRLSRSGESMKLCKELEKRIVQLEQFNSRIQLLENKVKNLEASVNSSKHQLRHASGTSKQSDDHSEDQLGLLVKRVRNLEAMLPDAAMEEKSETSENKGVGNG